MDEKKEAQRVIEVPKQKGSPMTYIKDFKYYSTRTEFGDEAIIY